MRSSELPSGISPPEEQTHQLHRGPDSSWAGNGHYRALYLPRSRRKMAETRIKLAVALALSVATIAAPAIYFEIMGVDPNGDIRDTMSLTADALTMQPTWPATTFTPDTAEEMIASVTAYAVTAQVTPKPPGQ